MTKHIKDGLYPFGSDSARSPPGTMRRSAKEVAAAVADNAFPLSAKSVVDRIPKGAEWVLIGEASHGTREFYDMRAGEQITIVCASM